jgi:hypothetical protein
MFQLFETYVASVLSRCCICCSDHTHMLQEYIVNVSSVLDVCCKCSMSRRWKWAQQRWSPQAQWSPRAWEAKLARLPPTCIQSNRRMRIAAVGGVEPACAATIAAASGQAGRLELHALFFDLPVITWSNSSPTNLF